jgi:hypothetical protein
MIEHTLRLGQVTGCISGIQLPHELAGRFPGLRKLVADLTGRDLDQAVPAKALDTVGALGGTNTISECATKTTRSASNRFQARLVNHQICFPS